MHPAITYTLLGLLAALFAFGWWLDGRPDEHRLARHRKFSLVLQIAALFGAQVVVNWRMMHGKVSPIHHDGRGVFEGLPSPFNATRYHSLVAKRDTIPDCLEVSAWTAEDEVMGLRHKDLPVHGVQFHPESILSEHGHDLLRNFLRMPSAASS